MSHPSIALNPYQGNVLIDHLPPIASRAQVLKSLLRLPPFPVRIGEVPVHIRMHYLMMLRELHVPSQEEGKLADTTDLLLRSGLHTRDPRNSLTWAQICNGHGPSTPKGSTPAALVAGLSGTGKTAAIENILCRYPQTIVHDEFPMTSKPLKQVVYLSVEVPASGRSGDLAAGLMQQWDFVTQENRFKSALGRGRRNGSAMLDEWRQVASSQFLGLLHLDEIQNLFKSPTLARRRSKTNSDKKLELSLVEDACLKMFLNLNNTSQFPVLFSGTPDGVSALTKRLATTQRITTGGYHHFPYFVDANDSFFKETFFPVLMQYQYVAKPLKMSNELAELVVSLSGGILRIIVALWVAAHRSAFERGTDDLQLDDFRYAADTFLAPLKPAITALRSRNPKLIADFEDMMQQDEHFWASFWTPQ